MRLWLSSHRQGDRVDLLRALVDGDHADRVGLIANALDGDTHQDAVVERETDAMRDLGFGVDRIDLRDYHKDPDALTTGLRRLGLLWVTGGNVFVLARSMHSCGFASAARALLGEDAIVYGGYSAGACVAGPDLDGLETMDDPGFLPEGYSSATSAPGLGLVPFRIVPHHESDHPERAAAARAVDVMERRRLTHQPLRDGQAVMIDGDSTAIV